MSSNKAADKKLRRDLIKLGFFLILSAPLTLAHENLEMYPSLNKPIQQQNQENNKQTTTYKCKFLTDLNFYDLSPLAKLGPFTFNGVNPNYNLSFNICDDIKDEGQRCNKNDPVMAVARQLTEEGKTECITLAGQGKEVQVDHYILDKEENNGIKIHLSGRQKCDDWRTYDLSIEIQCDPNAETIKNINVTEMHYCFKLIKIAHKSGCKIGQLSALWEWAQKYGWVIAIPFIGIGFVMLFVGQRWMKIVYYVTGIILTVSCIWLIFYTTFMQDNTQDAVGWVIFIFSILLGACLGFTFSRYTRLGNFFLGFISGFCIGLMVFIAIVFLATSYWALWCLSVGLGVISGGLTFYLSDIMKIHSTAFFGAFFLTNGIGMFAGRFQNPFTVIELIRNGEIQSVDPLFYIYLAGCIVFYIIGSIYQYKKMRQSRKIPRSNVTSLRGRTTSIQ